MRTRKAFSSFGLAVGALSIFAISFVSKASAASPQVQWMNHLDLLPGDPSVTTVQYQQHPNFGTNVAGVVITSSTLGSTDSNNEDKFVSMALELPKQTKITGVRLCYENSDPGPSGTFISQIRLAQFNTTDASTANVVLDDSTAQDASGANCVSSTVKKAINASNGPIVLSLRIDTANTSDQIVVRTLGLLVK